MTVFLNWGSIRVREHESLRNMWAHTGFMWWSSIIFLMASLASFGLIIENTFAIASTTPSLSLKGTNIGLQWRVGVC